MSVEVRAPRVSQSYECVHVFSDFLSEASKGELLSFCLEYFLFLMYVLASFLWEEVDSRRPSLFVSGVT